MKSRSCGLICWSIAREMRFALQNAKCSSPHRPCTPGALTVLTDPVTLTRTLACPHDDATAHRACTSLCKRTLKMPGF